MKISSSYKLHHFVDKEVWGVKSEKVCCAFCFVVKSFIFKDEPIERNLFSCRKLIPWIFKILCWYTKWQSQMLIRHMRLQNYISIFALLIREQAKQIQALFNVSRLDTNGTITKQMFKLTVDYTSCLVHFPETILFISSLRNLLDGNLKMSKLV